MDTAKTLQIRAVPQEIVRGQTLAELEVDEIISKVDRWAREGRLNRGLRIRLPFYDDHAAEMRWLDLDVIPNGRIMFVPAFVVLAVHRMALSVIQDSSLTESTRSHVLHLLRTLQRAFGDVPADYQF
jgi:hypothetical protein